MPDFRSHAERQADEVRLEREARSKTVKQTSDAQAALKRLEPQIDNYSAEVQGLRSEIESLKDDNQSLTEALRAQMQSVEDLRDVLATRMDAISTDMDQVHRKVRSLAEDDMRLVQALGDNQNDRIAKLTMLVSGDD